MCVALVLFSDMNMVDICIGIFITGTYYLYFRKYLLLGRVYTLLPTSDVG